MQISKDKINIELARQGLTMAELAEKTGYSRARVNAILNSINILPRTAGKIARALGVDVEEILTK